MRRGFKRVALSFVMIFVFTLSGMTNIFNVAGSGSTASAYNAVKPKTPTGLKVWKENSSKVNLQWNQVVGVDGYHIYYKTDDGDWKYVPDAKGNIRLIKWYKDKSCSLSGFDESESIAFRVASVKGGVESVLSSIVNIKMLEIKKLYDLDVTVNQNDSYDLPTTVSALMSNGSNRNVSIKWNKSSVDTSLSGQFIYIGSVAGYKGNVKLTVNVKPAELSLKDVAKIYNSAVVYIEVQDKKHNTFATGSGFIVSEDGKVVTNYHVIDKAAFATVKLSDGTKFEVEGVLNYNKTQDIAVLQLKNASGLSCVKLGDSSKVELGDNVLAIGSPSGLENSLSIGIVSGLNRQSDRGYTDIQTTAGIARGSSGGALFNAKGEVIGITYAGYNSSGDLGFVIPINEVVPYLNGGSLKALYEVNNISLVDKPKTPTGLKAWPVDGNKIDIQWDQVEGADGYYLCVGDSSDTSKWTFLLDENGNKKLLKWSAGYSAEMTNVKDGDSFYLRVAAVKDGIESDYSTPVNAVMTATSKVPTGLKAWPGKDGRFLLQWDKIDGVDGYYAYYSVDQKNWYFWKESNGSKMLLSWKNEYSASLSGITPGLVLYFKVTSVKNGIESDPSPVVSSTYVTAPTGLRAWMTGSDINIQWDKMDGVDGFHLSYSTDLVNWKGWLDDKGAKRLLVWYSDISGKLNNVKGPVTIYFKVASVKNGVESEYSEPMKFEVSQ